MQRSNRRWLSGFLLSTCSHQSQRLNSSTFNEQRVFELKIIKPELISLWSWKISTIAGALKTPLSDECDVSAQINTLLQKMLSGRQLSKRCMFTVSSRFDQQNKKEIRFLRIWTIPVYWSQMNEKLLLHFERLVGGWAALLTHSSGIFVLYLLALLVASSCMQHWGAERSAHVGPLWSQSQMQVQ